MRVLIDTTFAQRGPTGTGVYVRRLVDALRQLGVDVVETANPARRPPAGGGLGSAANLLADLRWSALDLRREARRVGADVVHHPLPAPAPWPAVPQVVTVHDVAFERLPERFDRRWRAYARLVHRAAARRAGAVVAVSQTTALDVRALWGVPARRVVVAPHGPGQQLARRRRAAEPRCFLYVGDDEPRKNLDLLLAAHRIYREREGPGALPLVLAGAATARAREPGMDGLARPQAADLERLYAQAAALVHPSLHEGFGLTPLEAMGAGTPVIAARSPGVVEICGTAAVYVDPRDAGALAAEMARVASDRDLRRALSQRGARRAEAFSWERSARAHVEAYTLAMSS